MFTRLSNFSYGNYQIANISEVAVNTDTQLIIQIQKYEKECLEMILGKSLYDEFMSNLELDSDGFWKLKSSADEKWKSLLNGSSFENESSCCSENVNWRGLVVKIATIQEKDVIETLMALYIFYRISLNTRTLNTGTGEGKLKSDSNTQESSKNKRVDAWNEFVQWADYGFSCDNISLNQFLCLKKEDYPNAIPICLKTLTYYDI